MAMTRRVGRAYAGVIRWAILLAFLNFIAFLVLFLNSQESVNVWVSNASGIAIPLLAGIGCFGFRQTASYKRLSQVKHLPVMLGGAALSYGLGMLVYTYEKKVLNIPTANPGGGDFFFLLQYLFFIGAIALWPSKPLPGAMRWRTWSDAVVLLTALMAFGWVYLIGPAVKESDLNSIAILISTAYPVLDILIIFSVLQMMRKGFDPRFRVATHIFVMGLTINTVGDLYLAISQIDGLYQVGNWLDMSWPLTASLAAISGMIVKVRMQVPGFREAQNDDRIIVAQRTWTLYAPYVLVPAVGALIIQVAWTEHSPFIRNGLYLFGLALIIAILLRQLIVIAENGSLYGKLRDAYDELEVKSMQVSLAADDAERINERLREMTEELSGQNRTLAESNEVLEEMATRDGMTGLANHRSFQERLRAEVSKSTRHKHPLALALIDVDFFKQYNDHYGHPAGDDVLRSIARLLQETTREGDLAARYGGEEFALLLPFVDREEAMRTLDRLREAVATFPFKHRRVTLSIGLCMISDDYSYAEKMIEQADKALYSAKSRGRNQVVCATELAPISLADSDSEALRFDAGTPMGFASILAAGLQYHPQALAHEPQSALIAGLLATLELKDPMSRGLPQRVLWFAMRLAHEAVQRGDLQMTPSAIRGLGYGALLHDIGRIGIPESLLTSSAQFTPEERSQVEAHATLGAELLRKFPGLAPGIPLVLHHHERWDGRGYPEGLSNESIPRGARILAYADAFMAMSSDRPYAAKRSYLEICEEFKRQAGKQFDPELLPAFLAVPEHEWDRLRNCEQVDWSTQPRAA